MNITMELTDDMKRAIRYTGFTRIDVETEINRQVSDFFENLIKQAKQKYMITKTMEDIDPLPVDNIFP